MERQVEQLPPVRHHRLGCYALSQSYDDTDQYAIGIGYQYTPQIKFWLAYNYIDYGNGGSQEYQGDESVILFRTAIDF